ncbi:hypothetical protein L0Y69_03120, partial [bacterium]|nr:hypothetical protein [bacterium]
MQTLRQVSEKVKQRLGLWLQTDIDYLLSGGSALLAGRFFSLFFSFLLSIAFAHYLAPEIYGTYKFILSIVAILLLFSLTGSGPAITRAVARGNEGSYLDIFRLNLKWNILVFLLSLSVSGYYFLNGNSTLALGLMIAGVLAPIMQTADLHGAFLGGRKEFGKAAIFTGLRALLAASIMYGALLFSPNPVVLILVFFAAHACISLATFIFTIVAMRPNKKVDPEARRLTKHTSIMGLFAGIANNIDDILVFHYLGAAELALYAFIVLIPNQVISITKYLMSLAVPKFAAREKSLVQEGLFRKSLMVFLALFAIFLVYVFSAPWIFATFFPRYIDAVFYSQVY